MTTSIVGFGAVGLFFLIGVAILIAAIIIYGKRAYETRDFYDLVRCIALILIGILWYMFFADLMAKISEFL